MPKARCGLSRLQPSAVYSSHLPAAVGTSFDRFVDVLATVPGAEPAHAPSQEEFGMMLAALATMQGQAVGAGV